MAPACVSYEPAPLHPETALAVVLAEPPTSSDAPSFIDLANRLTQRHPRLVATRAAAARDALVAGIKTPLANPSLGAGPVWLNGGGVASSAAWGAESVVSMLIDWRGIRGLNDARLRAVAARSAVEAEVAWREEFLGLRGTYLRWALAGREAELQDAVARVAAKARDQTRQRVAAGFADALDAALAELNAEQSRFAALQATHRSANAGTAVLALVGYRPRSADAHAEPATGSPATRSTPPRDAAPELPPLPDHAPHAAELRARVLESPDLLRIRARYEIAERQLELAVALQYPALSLGGSYELENRTNRFSAGGSLSLPLFNRNQQGIAQTAGARRALYEEFMATLRQRVNRVAVARIALERALERRRVASAHLDPAIAQLDTAVRRVVATGRYDPAKTLVALRRLGTARLQRFAAERTAYERWLALELAIGAPMWNALDAPNTALPNQPPTPTPTPTDEGDDR